MHKEDSIKVTFWGVRGSYPQCKKAYAEIGGDTSCVSVEVGGRFLIFDAGTGIIDAGEEILNRGLKRATLFISHVHADHISGFSFFRPLHQPDFELTVIASGLRTPENGGQGIESILSKAAAPPYFPVPWDKIACKRNFVDVPAGSRFSLSPVKVSTIALDHPGGSSGYRVDIGDKAMCYMTDTGHTPGEINADWVNFAQRANLLIYDAAFTEEEFAAKPGWGHSTWNQALAFAKTAAIRDVALFHHSPHHDDVFMNALEAEARTHFSRVFVARQGMSCII